MFSATDLRPRLSEAAAIVVPGDLAFANLTSRCKEWHAPDIVVVVKAITENDVQETIRYANEKGMPFLARSGGHGATEALADAMGAIQIDFRAMNQVEVSPSSYTARIGGGATVKKVVADLMAVGTQTVTGICECVGVSAPQTLGRNIDPPYEEQVAPRIETSIGRPRDENNGIDSSRTGG